MVTQSRLNVTLYGHCLSCLLYVKYNSFAVIVKIVFLEYCAEQREAETGRSFRNLWIHYTSDGQTFLGGGPKKKKKTLAGPM
jgi:hypothetical protein